MTAWEIFAFAQGAFWLGAFALGIISLFRSQE